MISKSKFGMWFIFIINVFAVILFTFGLWKLIMRWEGTPIFIFVSFLAIVSWFCAINSGIDLFKRKIYYKVVKVAGWDNYIGKYYTSVFTSHEYFLKYKIGTPIKPKIGKILIFDTEKNARDFMRCLFNKKLVLFKCKAKKVKKQKEVSMKMRSTNIYKFWMENWSRKTFPFLYMPTPTGTLSASEITLLEEKLYVFYMDSEV